jgi:hypothetical protein
LTEWGWWHNAGTASKLPNWFWRQETTMLLDYMVSIALSKLWAIEYLKID